MIGCQAEDFAHGWDTTPVDGPPARALSLDEEDREGGGFSQDGNLQGGRPKGGATRRYFAPTLGQDPAHAGRI